MNQEQEEKRYLYRIRRKLRIFLKYGRWRSVFSGSGMDLKTIEPVPAGELVHPRDIDYRATSRTGKLHRKVSYVQMRATLVLLYDCSPSMRIWAKGEQSRIIGKLFAASARAYKDAVVQRDIKDGDLAAAVSDILYRRNLYVVAISDFVLLTEWLPILKKISERAELIPIIVRSRAEIEPPPPFFSIALYDIQGKEKVSRRVFSFGRQRRLGKELVDNINDTIGQLRKIGASPFLWVVQEDLTENINRLYKHLHM